MRWCACSEQPAERSAGCSCGRAQPGAGSIQRIQGPTPHASDRAQTKYVLGSGEARSLGHHSQYQPLVKPLIPRYPQAPTQERIPPSLDQFCRPPREGRRARASPCPSRTARRGMLEEQHTLCSYGPGRSAGALFFNFAQPRDRHETFQRQPMPAEDHRHTIQHSTIVVGISGMHQHKFQGRSQLQLPRRYTTRRWMDIPPTA